MDWRLIRRNEVDSTSDEIKRRLAVGGVSEGLAVLAGSQTKGRGRMGRAFSSPEGKGLYLSVLLKPKCTPRELLWLTPWTAVAMCSAIEGLCGARPGVKWVNDLVLGGKKLGGILAERMGEYLVLGIGVNLTQTAADFGPELAPIATSLTAELGRAPTAEALAGAVLAVLGEMREEFPHEKARYLERYRADCVTLRQSVRVLRPERDREGVARGLDEDFGLVVDYPDGTSETVTAGEVSVRRMYGDLE